MRWKNFTMKILTLRGKKLKKTLNISKILQDGGIGENLINRLKNTVNNLWLANGRNEFIIMRWTQGFEEQGWDIMVCSGMFECIFLTDNFSCWLDQTQKHISDPNFLNLHDKVFAHGIDWRHISAEIFLTAITNVILPAFQKWHREESPWRQNCEPADSRKQQKQEVTLPMHSPWTFNRMQYCQLPGCCPSNSDFIQSSAL